MTFGTEKFENWNPQPGTLAIVEAALVAYEDMKDFEPTLRTSYYQLVQGDDKVLDNKQSEYKRLGAILTKARNAGLFPWDALLYKGRIVEEPYIRSDASEILGGIPYHLSLDKWEGQEYYVEVFVEKQAQEGVVEKVCSKYHVPSLSCKGYLSSTAAYDAGKRFEQAAQEGKELVLIHLGDHDPSGLDMTRDNGDRLDKYGWLARDLTVDRIALNMNQIDSLSLPPDPTKEGDSRSRDYKRKYGDKMWELDAIKPQDLQPILDSAIRKYLDIDLFNDMLAQQKEMRSDLTWLGEHADEYLEQAREERLADE
jgi:hypothetical protein